MFPLYHFPVYLKAFNFNTYSIIPSIHERCIAESIDVPNKSPIISKSASGASCNVIDLTPLLSSAVLILIITKPNAVDDNIYVDVGAVTS